jgi:hypothetical protein
MNEFYGWLTTPTKHHEGLRGWCNHPWYPIRVAGHPLWSCGDWLPIDFFFEKKEGKVHITPSKYQKLSMFPPMT